MPWMELKKRHFCSPQSFSADRVDLVDFDFRWFQCFGRCPIDWARRKLVGPLESGQKSGSNK